jgi:hypothetical protein
MKNIKEDDYQYPEGVTNFHIYSEIRNEKELLCVKSWIATQNLEKCKLYIWSDYDITDNKLLMPYMDYVTLKVYDPVKEAKGTILEKKLKHLKAKDHRHWLKSDLFRILITHKYGGIFSDMDVVYLRDFKPLLDQEFVYQWGGETDFINQGACATFLSTFKNSEFSTILMKELSEAPVLPDTTTWGKELLGKVYSYYRNFTIFPSPFFNIEWQINLKHPGLANIIEDGWFVKTEHSNKLFPESFAWHWHNTSHKHKPIQEGSKFNLLQQLTDKKLKSIGNFVDYIPEPTIAESNSFFKSLKRYLVGKK